MLAAISTDYYTRPEQDRITPSTSVLAALVRVLHLNDAQRDYLYELAGRQVNRPRRTVQKVQRQLLAVLTELSVTPGMILGRYLDILAWNPMAAALLNTDFSTIPEKKRNYVRHIFTDPPCGRCTRTGRPRPTTPSPGCAAGPRPVPTTPD
ncbi:helix-turn-helix domain-containing protein [Kibdelosporangium persicum]|uniref:MmyB-like transcription regulator ligand binding domain-containing protein n=1 Tax=Kibdelosporangium persicum TaxID=2698649 RepID=A0ABX2F8U1_9PSEU|nr:helix-turn-helix domain-containing protein [Kibdelosporangium persicum]NRN67243.1 hypothetical protein [Kibdelosporangium persicum]